MAALSPRAYLPYWVSHRPRLMGQAQSTAAILWQILAANQHFDTVQLCGGLTRDWARGSATLGWLSDYKRVHCRLHLAWTPNCKDRDAIPRS